MIKKEFWQNVAELWSKESDGIVIPKPVIEPIIPDELDDPILDDEMQDILADLGLDDF